VVELGKSGGYGGSMSASASQVIEQILSLPQRDLTAVAAALRERRAQTTRETALQGGVREGFEKIAHKVFTTHEELLKKLAQ
jgi:hypothetical protein